jgi:hypothetical protein
VPVIHCNINVCISLLTVKISVFLKRSDVSSHFLIALNMYARIFQRRVGDHGINTFGECNHNRATV